MNRIISILTLAVYISMSNVAYAQKWEHIVALCCTKRTLNEYKNVLPKIHGEKTLIIAESLLKEVDFKVLQKDYEEIIPIKNYYVSGHLEYEVNELHKRKPISRLIAVEETELLRAARLRELLQLPGQDYTSTYAYRDKVSMKTILKGKIRVPHYKAIASAVDLIEFIRDNGYPVIFKERRGMGSKSLVIIKGEQDLKNVLMNPEDFDDYLDQAFEAEEFIQGTVYHIDGLVWNGKMIACWPSKYFTQNVEMLQGNHTGGYILAKDNPLVKRLNDYAQKVINTLPTPLNMAFHLEVFLTDEKQEIVFCEIASRVGGGGIIDIWDASFGINLLQEFIRMQAGLPISKQALKFKPQPKQICGHMLFPMLEGKLLKIATQCPLSFVKKYTVFAKEGDVLASAESCADYIALINLVVASSEEEMNERSETAAKWFAENCIISPNFGKQ